jgi:diaminopimelate decarboxylase
MGGVGEREWHERIARAVELVGTPCYVAAWPPIDAALNRIRQMPSRIPLRSWLSFKTHPLPHLAARWLADGGGVEVVSEAELATVLGLGASVDQLLVNGVAKHAWLPRHGRDRLRVHFDSVREVEQLLAPAIAQRWRVGVRCHVPDERDARAPEFGGQFGMSGDEAIDALTTLRERGADLQSVHFHLGQRRQHPDAYRRAVAFVAAVCAAANVRPAVLDCGGGLPAPDDPECDRALDGLATAVREAPELIPSLQEIWLENGRFITTQSAALAMRVLDVKERDECRYVICDGGRTNHALAADHGPHALLTLPTRSGRPRLTTVCGPTCMTDDRLGRWPLPDDLAVGDVIAWRDAGAYHLPWETRFSHGLCAVVWDGGDGRLVVARERERPDAALRRWSMPEVFVHA